MFTKIIKPITQVAVALSLAALAVACSSSTAGSPTSHGSTPGGSPSAVTSEPPSGNSASGVAIAYVHALFVDKDATKAASLVDPSLRRQALAQIKLEVREFGADDRFQPGAPTGTPSDLVVPVKNVGNGGQFLASSYKVHLSLAQSSGSWLVNGYKKVDWDASAKASAGGTNPPFTCTPGFVTTLRGYPVSRLVAHYPVMNVKPDSGIAGRRGISEFHTGELSVVYTAQSTGLPQGPSKSMYSCFVRYAAKNGWRPDRHMNTSEQKAHKRDEPLVYYFFDSGSRFKGGNELSVGFFTAKQAFGHGSQVDISMDPHGFIPDLPAPPK